MREIIPINMCRALKTLFHPSSKNKFSVFFLFALFIFIFAPIAWGQNPWGFEWLHQFGPARTNIAFGIDANASGVYVVGYHQDTWEDPYIEVFLRKYDHDGNEDWSILFGSSRDDWGLSISAHSSGVYIAGFTRGTLPGQISAGGPDAFVCKYDFDGNEIWTHQFGTSGGDVAEDIYVDDSGVYVGGSASGPLSNQPFVGDYDSFVRKYDFDGNEIWTRMLGVPEGDEVLGVTADATGVYVAGYVDCCALPGQQNQGNWDAYIRKYDLNGNEIWTDQFGTSEGTDARDIVVNSSGVYLCGLAFGAFPGYSNEGFSDLFVRKYNHDGSMIWTRQFGTPQWDWVYRMDADALGVYAVGRAGEALPGQTFYGIYDAFIRKYDVSGNEVSTCQFGTWTGDEAQDVATDDSGTYVCGLTLGTFPGQTKGSTIDAFLAKLGTVPATETIQLMKTYVNNLVEDGKLLPDKSDGLIGKLNEALKNLNKDKPNERVACNKLSDFINQVNSCIMSGALTNPEDGLTLIDEANKIISELCGS